MAIVCFLEWDYFCIYLLKPSAVAKLKTSFHNYFKNNIWKYLFLQWLSMSPRGPTAHLDPSPLRDNLFWCLSLNSEYVALVTAKVSLSLRGWDALSQDSHRKLHPDPSMFVLAQTETHGGLDETASFYLLIISTLSAIRMTPVLISAQSNAFSGVCSKAGPQISFLWRPQWFRLIKVFS